LREGDIPASYKKLGLFWQYWGIFFSWSNAAWSLWTVLDFKLYLLSVNDLLSQTTSLFPTVSYKPWRSLLSWHLGVCPVIFHNTDNFLGLIICFPQPHSPQLLKWSEWRRVCQKWGFNDADKYVAGSHVQIMGQSGCLCEIWTSIWVFKI